MRLKNFKTNFSKYKVKKAVLFGSNVKGTADSRSDIDLMVDTNLKGIDFLAYLKR